MARTGLENALTAAAGAFESNEVSELMHEKERRRIVIDVLTAFQEKPARSVLEAIQRVCWVQGRSCSLDEAKEALQAAVDAMLLPLRAGVSSQPTPPDPPPS